MRRGLFCLIAFILIATFGLFAGTRPMAGSQKGASLRNSYVLRVEGTKGVRLEMLLITKPTERDNPTRETASIAVPFSKQFTAASCYAWFDTLPGGASGQAGDEYHILLEKNGRPTAEVEGVVKPGNKATGGL